jgi:nucleotide-binding universal stress UspA family protein
MSQSNKSYVIVVAVDYSEMSNLVLERAFEVAAEKKSASVHVLNVLSVYAADAAGAGAPLPPSIDDAAKQLKTYVEQQANAFRLNHAGETLEFLYRLSVHQRVESPSMEVAQLAVDLEADLVVVGTHGRRGLSRLMMGSVAESTVRLAPCPVLVVRPKAVPSPVPAIQPACPRCIEARRTSAGAELWCSQHGERHGQRHTYYQSDRVGAETNLPLMVR